MDLQTDKPIVGAKICELRGNPVTTNDERCVISDSQGNFSIETLHQRRWLFIMIENFPPDEDYVVSAPGYKDQTVRAPWGQQKITVTLHLEGQG